MQNDLKEAMSSGDINQMTSCQQKYLENNIENTKKTLDASTKSTIKILDSLKNKRNKL